MSESPSKAGTPSAKPTFSDKEETVLKAAWFCLKSGPPEVDIKKLAKAAGFNTEKTASNTWGVIKKKLNAMAPTLDLGEANDGANGDAGTMTTPKKRTKKDADDIEMPSTAKKPRKTPAKKAKAVKEEDGNDEGGAANDG